MAEAPWPPGLTNGGRIRCPGGPFAGKRMAASRTVGPPGWSQSNGGLKVVHSNPFWHGDHTSFWAGVVGVVGVVGTGAALGRGTSVVVDLAAGVEVEVGARVVDGVGEAGAGANDGSGVAGRTDVVAGRVAP